MNAVAAGRFTAADRPLLWDIALHAVASDPTRPVAFTAPDGTSMLGAVKPVYDRGIMIAALVTFDRPDDRPSPADRPSFGWESLTDSEHTLVRLVADGLTNREAAARLYLSHHTVDSHLRHIFRKLGINSRVQLARIAASMRTDPTTESA
jgi:DNA-binding CsgD family transcriptional regulator